MSSLTASVQQLTMTGYPADDYEPCIITSNVDENGMYQ